MAETLLEVLPPDFASGTFIGRALSPAGPCVIVLREGHVFDLTDEVATVSGAIDRKRFSGGRDLRSVEQGLPAGWKLLSPADLQCIKACGVTFAVSAIERVIEERARGDASKAAEIRASLEAKVGAGIRAVVPGSAEAAELKQALIDEGMWSQYLEVAIGPDAEVFSKSPVLSTVGAGAEIGVRWRAGSRRATLLVPSFTSPQSAASAIAIRCSSAPPRSAAWPFGLRSFLAARRHARG